MVVVQGQQQADQHGADGQSGRAGVARELGVDQFQDARVVQERVELPDLRVRDLHGGVGHGPGTAGPELLLAAPGPGDAHGSGPRSGRIAVASSSGGTWCW